MEYKYKVSKIIKWSSHTLKIQPATTKLKYVCAEWWFYTLLPWVDVINVVTNFVLLLVLSLTMLYQNIWNSLHLIWKMVQIT